MTIVNLRGTHGSGKSTVATQILAMFPNDPYGSGRKPDGYTVFLPRTRKTLAIVGSYATACGGCDGIQPYADIWPRVEAAAADHDHVLFEGALISTTYGSIGLASEPLGGDFVFAFLDTPQEVAVARVNQRRAARGAAPLADPKNVVEKWATIDRLHYRLATGNLADKGRRVAVIDHTNATRDVLKLFGVKLKGETA